MKPILSSLLLVTALSLSVAQDENKDPAAGHSYHGEVFNEGPRQAAVLIPGTGDISFEVTTKSEETQKFFNQGVGQLHGFWDFEAERSFRQAAALDPDCAMAYWGMAMANFKNNTRGKGFIDEAVERKDKVSERDQLWIDGLAAYFENPKADQKKRLRDFVRSIEKIALKYPDDLETQAFLMKQIYYNPESQTPLFRTPSHESSSDENLVRSDAARAINWSTETPSLMSAPAVLRGRVPVRNVALARA